ICEETVLVEPVRNVGELTDLAQAESKQIEEIVRLEHEIQRLQGERALSSVSPCVLSPREMERECKEEIQRLEKQASQVVQEFLELLNFGALDESGQILEQSLPIQDNLAIEQCPEQELDEGFHTDQEMATVAADGRLGQLGIGKCLEDGVNVNLAEDGYNPEDWRNCNSPGVEWEREEIQNLEPESLDTSDDIDEEPIYSLPPDIESDYDEDELNDPGTGNGDTGRVQDGSRISTFTSR
ncbi:hypothetical protein scyTo_0027232, partial [Scyliorhinus torazame]|nr:hypothetical protein [Scyliorhinus torazame]